MSGYRSLPQKLANLSHIAPPPGRASQLGKFVPSTVYFRLTFTPFTERTKDLRASPAMEAEAPAPPEPAPVKPAIGLRLYVVLWVVITIWLGHEYWLLNHPAAHGVSFLRRWHARGLLLPGHKLVPDPGSDLSWRLGWIGFLTMALTNLYILRKRLPQLANKGSMPNWLDFHIFCGLLGPTLICFHANFRVAGLVAVSFWSMMISFGSGIVGRYFYTQLLRQRADMKVALMQLEEGFIKVLQLRKVKLEPQQMKLLLKAAYEFVGGTDAMIAGRATLPEVLGATIYGDLRLLFGGAPPTPANLPALRRPLKEYALTRRRLATASYFRALMGYWHAFHAPFAVFMYVVAVIHIAAAYVFRVH